MSAPPPRRDPVVRALASHACASVGMSLPWPLLLIVVWEQTHSDLALGLAGASRLLPYVLLSWAAGRSADRWARDRVIRVTLVGRLVALLVAWVGLVSGQLALAVAGCAVAVAAATPAYPALAAALPRACRHDDEGRQAARATEVLVTIEVSSFVVGPALGGLLLFPQLRGWVFPVACGLVVLGFALVATLRLPSVTAEERAAAVPLLREIRRTRTIGTITVMSLVNFLVALVAVALVPMAARLWSGTASTYGIATGVLGFGALAGPLLGIWGGGHLARVRWGLVALGGALVAVAPTPALVWAMAPLAVIGAVAVHVEASATSLLQERLPNSVCASVLGLTDTFMVSAALVGSLVGPALVDLLHPTTLLVLLGLLTVAAAAPRKVHQINETVTESAEQPLAKTRIAH